MTAASAGSDPATAQPAEGGGGMTKEELALEDRRRRNRETQRAIRKRKAQKLQDSEVKIALHEQELERARTALEEAQQENAHLRKQLQNCRCGALPYAARNSGSRQGSVISDSTRTRSPSPDPPADHASKKRKSPTEALASVFSSRPPVSSSIQSSPRAQYQKNTHPGHGFPHAQHPGLQATLHNTVTSLASLPLRDLTSSRHSPPTSAITSGHGVDHPQHHPAYVRHAYTPAAYGTLPSHLPYPHYLPPSTEHASRRYHDTVMEDSRSSQCPPGCQCGASSSVQQAEASETARDDYVSSRVHKLSSHRSTDSSNSGLTLPPLLSHGRSLALQSKTRNGKGKSVSQPTTQDEIDEMRLPLPVASFPNSRYPRAFGSADYGSPGTSTRESSIGYQESDVRLGSSPPTTIATKPSVPASISEDPLVASPAEQTDNGEGTDDTIMADGGEKGDGQLPLPSPGQEKVQCCNGFIECDEEADQAFTKGTGQRSTLDDFRALFGDKVAVEGSLATSEPSAP